MQLLLMINQPLPRAAIIDQIILLCGFADDLMRVKFITQQGWSGFIHVTTICIDEIKNFHTFSDVGAFEAKPLAFHLQLIKCFLLFYRRKSYEYNSILTEDDVMDITKDQLHEYCCSNVNVYDLAAAGSNIAAAATPALGKSGIVSTVGTLTAWEFCRGVKRDKTHYEDLKDDNYFNSWNRGFIATANMNHKHLILDEEYFPVDDV
jgi:hypothetical protein